MKIDGNRPAHDTQAADGPQRAAKDTAVRQPGVVAATGGSDRVELSGDAALRALALKAALDAPSIRADLVHQMREKVDRGDVGRDSGRLADAIIDDLLS